MSTVSNVIKIESTRGDYSITFEELEKWQKNGLEHIYEFIQAVEFLKTIPQDKSSTLKAEKNKLEANFIYVVRAGADADQLRLYFLSCAFHNSNGKILVSDGGSSWSFLELLNNKSLTKNQWAIISQAVIYETRKFGVASEDRNLVDLITNFFNFAEVATDTQWEILGDELSRLSKLNKTRPFEKVIAYFFDLVSRADKTDPNLYAKLRIYVDTIVEKDCKYFDKSKPTQEDIVDLFLEKIKATTSINAVSTLQRDLLQKAYYS